jgi:hypothetical protein
VQHTGDSQATRIVKEVEKIAEDVILIARSQKPRLTTGYTVA